MASKREEERKKDILFSEEEESVPSPTIHAIKRAELVRQESQLGSENRVKRSLPPRSDSPTISDDNSGDDQSWMFVTVQTEQVLPGTSKTYRVLHKFVTL
jgi:hypothetical protein